MPLGDDGRLLLNAVRVALELSPRGRTLREVIGLLADANVRADRKQVMLALDELHRRGVVTLDPAHRWHFRRGGRLNPPAGKRGSEGPTGDPATLYAVYARLRRDTEDASEPEATGEPSHPAKPPIAKLLRYYEATQKSDPRGAISQFVDRHQSEYQLFHAIGDWWARQTQLDIELGDLPPSFREALSLRPETAVAIGWPLAILEKDGLQALVPVGLLSADAHVNEDSLRVTVVEPDIVANPDWMREAARRPGWTLARLEEVLSAASGLSLPEFCRGLSSAAATQVRGQLRPEELLRSFDANVEGIHNSAALFLPSDATFTKGAARDLATLSEMSEVSLRGTALQALLGDYLGSPVRDEPLLNPVPLTPNQLEAAQLALASPVTAITGPPGTGKTQVIVSLICSALCAGKSVLLASRNHQALDSVEEKLAELSPETDVLVRAKDSAGDRDTDFLREIANIVNEADPLPSRNPSQSLILLRDHAEMRSAALKARSRAEDLNMRLSDYAERRAAIMESPGVVQGRRRLGLVARIYRWLFRQTSVADVPDTGATLEELDEAIQKDRLELESLDLGKDPVEATKQIADGMVGLFADLVTHHRGLRGDRKAHLVREQMDLELSGRVKAHQLSEEVARLVLQARPVWAVTTLSVPARVPLLPGLFDYVIFDEASQCDIASALPLLARAKQAVVVGDPQQLEFIPQLSLAKERALFGAVGLPLAGMGVYMQSRNSLFGFCAAMVRTERCHLRDQFRSAPAIVDYLNNTFYGGALRPTRDDGDFRPPPGARPGLAWSDIRGTVSIDPAGGPCNQLEARALVEHLKLLLVDQEYAGSVGVISPFNAQVALLQREIAGYVPQTVAERARLKISTVDGFQGGERDVIFFSVVAGQGMRPGSLAFLQREGRRFNVAISRARAIAHIFGDLTYAQRSSIRHLSYLAARATEQPKTRNGTVVFDSIWERRVDAALRRRGLEPHPQHEVAGRRLDFALYGSGGIKLDLEVDGRRWHMASDGRRKTDDLWRDHQMKGLGWKVRRFWVHELERDMEGCLDLVERDLAAG